VVIKRDGKLLRPKRLPATCSSSAPERARRAASSTASPRCRTAPTCCGSRPRSRTSRRSAAWWSEIRKVIPNAKLVYNNSPSFNWTLNFRQQVFDA
jgi:isocitrate lyase